MKNISYTKLVTEKHKRWKELVQQWKMRHVPAWGFTEDHAEEKDEIEQAVALKYSALMSRSLTSQKDLDEAREKEEILKKRLYEVQQERYRVERDQNQNRKHRDNLHRKYGADVCRKLLKEESS